MKEFQVVQPPSLPALSTVKNNTVIIGYDPDTGKLVRMFASVLLTGTGYPEWEPGEEYDEEEIVIYQLRFWQSLDNDNTGNIPSEGDYWAEVSPTGLTQINIDGGTPDSVYGEIPDLDGGEP